MANIAYRFKSKGYIYLQAAFLLYIRENNSLNLLLKINIFAALKKRIRYDEGLYILY